MPSKHSLVPGATYFCLIWITLITTLRAPRNFFMIAHLYNGVTKLSSHCSQNFINFKIGDLDLNIFSLIHEREFIVFLVYTVYVYNFTGVQASGVIVIFLQHCCLVWSKIIGPHSSGNFNDAYECIYSHMHIHMNACSSKFTAH